MDSKPEETVRIQLKEGGPSIFVNLKRREFSCVLPEKIERESKESHKPAS